MKTAKIMMALAALTSPLCAGDLYVYARAGEAICAPRALPSAGVRQDTGAVVLGLHGAGDEVCAACGWFRVIPSAARAARQEVLTFGAAPAALSLAERIATLWAAPELAAMQEDARIAAVLSAVAQAVTGAVDRAVTVTIPAAGNSGREPH